jgi:hypothetical protein
MAKNHRLNAERWALSQHAQAGRLAVPHRPVRVSYSNFGALLLGSLLVLLPLSDAWAHGGGLDSYGCHHNRKLGGYHCHRGALAGQAFASQDDMLRTLNQQKGEPSPGQHNPAESGMAAPKHEVCVEERGTGRIVCGRVVQ